MSTLHQALTILVVEDNEDDLFLIQRAITKARLLNPVQVVRDGQEAIEYLSGTGRYADRSAHPLPFLVLLDLHMPRKDGFEVLAWLRHTPACRDISVAVLTASAEERDYRKALDLGADSYFAKPGSLDEFVGLMLRIRGNWILVNGPTASAASAI